MPINPFNLMADLYSKFSNCAIMHANVPNVPSADLSSTDLAIFLQQIFMSPAHCSSNLARYLSRSAMFPKHYELFSHSRPHA